MAINPTTWFLAREVIYWKQDGDWTEVVLPGGPTGPDYVNGLWGPIDTFKIYTAGHNWPENTGGIWSYNGSDWTLEHETTAYGATNINEQHRLWCADDDSIVVATNIGSSRGILVRNGGSWSQEFTYADDGLDKGRGLHGTRDGSAIYHIAWDDSPDYSYLYKRSSGGEWSAVASTPHYYAFQDLRVIAENDVWISGLTLFGAVFQPAIWHYNGSSLSLEFEAGEGSGVPYHPIWMNALGTEGWSAWSNDAGNIRYYYYDGTSWSLSQSVASSHYPIDITKHDRTDDGWVLFGQYNTSTYGEYDGTWNEEPFDAFSENYPLVMRALSQPAIPEDPELLETADEEHDRAWNQPFYFLHIEGFPKLWFFANMLPSDITYGWDIPDGWEYASGLMLSTDGLELRQAIDPLGGIADAETIDIQIDDPDFLSIIRKARGWGNGAELASNNISAGVDPSTLTLAHEISNAPATGPLYMGHQTITYDSISGTTITNPVRGRWAVLDDELGEVEWKPRIDWDATFATAPLVSVYPQNLVGRTITLYRSYYNPSDGLPLAKNQSEVRFRGTITAYGSTADGLGVVIQAISILDLLNSTAYAEVPEAPIEGFSLPYGAVTSRLNIVETQYNLNLQAKDTSEVCSLAVDLSGIETAQDLVNVVNTALKQSFDDSRGGAYRTYCEWFCKEQDGRVIIGAYPRGFFHLLGYTGFDVITNYFPKGATYDTWGVGLAGWVLPTAIKECAATKMLGFDGDITISWQDIAWSSDYPGLALVRDAFARWTNPADAEWKQWIIPGNNDWFSAVSLAPPAKAAWHNRDSRYIPFDASTYGDNFHPTPGDGGDFYLYVEDQMVYKSSGIDTPNDRFNLVDIAPDTGTRSRPAPETVMVPDSANEDVYIRQAWIPTCRTSIIYAGQSCYREGVHCLILQLLLSTGGGTTVNGDNDILPVGWGLGLPSAYVDIESFEALGDFYPRAALLRRYVFNTSFNFADFLENECKTLGFIVVLRNGKITAIKKQPPLYVNVAAEIDNSTRIYGDTSWQTNPEGLRNQLVLKCDYDFAEDEFYTTNEYYNLPSIVDNKRVESEEIENKGIRSTEWRGIAGTLNEINILFQDRLSQMGQESFTYTCQVTRAVDDLIIGDIVSVTDPLIPNPYLGTRGVTKHLGVVEEIIVNELTGEGQLTIRLPYEYDETYTPILELANPIVNLGGFAPSAKLRHDMINETFLTPENIWNLNSTHTWTTGTLIQVTDIKTGNSVNTSIISYNSTTGVIETADAIPSDTITTEGIVTIQPHDNCLTSASNDEFNSAFIANSSGLLSGQRGYKLL